MFDEQRASSMRVSSFQRESNSMSNERSTINDRQRDENVKHSDCWRARDQWWKCLDLFDNRREKCRKQIDELRAKCSKEMFEFFQHRREQLLKENPNAKLMLPVSTFHSYLTDFRNNANHNFSSHQTNFPFDNDDETR